MIIQNNNKRKKKKNEFEVAKRHKDKSVVFGQIGTRSKRMKWIRFKQFQVDDGRFELFDDKISKHIHHLGGGLKTTGGGISPQKK